ncbi:MAG: glycosyltransferase family 4 protein [Gammaproteobacteria bacterium]|nr:glycosyltransferase family 4 protein [Gammaproteobacteria bacterium]
MKILTFSTLYPDKVRTRHGIFVETRLRHLVANGNVESRVVVPVPWFPLQLGPYAEFARIPKEDIRHGISIQYHRFPLIPKIGMTLSPFLMAVFLYPTLKKIINEGYDFDLIDAHYFYPDGVAAALLSKWLNKPLTITARGTDLSLIPQYTLPRKMIQWAAKKASGMITVCQALKNTLVNELNVEEKKVFSLRNGVDLKLFYPSPERELIRKKLDIKDKSIISVGHLIERKGHHLVIEAMLKCADVTLYIAGDGEEENNLKALVSKLKLESRVIFLGALLQEQLRAYYCAVDMLILASSREGWANVLLESMACGTPVVATNVWGTPEVVSEPEAGVLVDRTITSIADGIKQLFQNYPDRKLTRKYAENFNWDSTTDGQEKLFDSIIKNRINYDT